MFGWRSRQLLKIKRERFVFVHADVFGECSNERSGEDAAGKDREIVGFNRLQEASADSCGLGYFGERNSSLFPPLSEFFAQCRHNKPSNLSLLLQRLEGV